MPQCPHCQAPYENGQSYCNTCGSYLPHPEPGNTVCPQCGVSVSPGQEFCPECNAPLKEARTVSEAEEPKGEPETSPPQPSPSPETLPRLPSWLIGLLVGSGMIIITLLILLFSRGISTPPAPPPEQDTSAAPAPALAPLAAADLKIQLQNVLATLRQAQMHKDIIEFMRVYSPTFPDLKNKRANTLKSWEYYDFTNLVFTVDKIQTIDPDNAVAWVTWYIDTRDRRSQELSSSTQAYKVRFAREQGKWRIHSLEEVKP